MANEDAGRKRQVSATDQNRARAAGSRKPGVVNRMMDQCRETVESVRLPKADWRTFAWGLVLLILIIFIVRNWAPLRINFFGWYLDAPRAVVFAIFFGLGMVATWLIEIRHRRARAGAEESATADEDEVLATEIPPEEFEPSPEDFAEYRYEEEESEDADATADFDDPLSAEDETAGDALSEEYGVSEPSLDSDDSLEDDRVLSDEDWDTEQDTAAKDADDESSDEGNSRSPFWRM